MEPQEIQEILKEVDISNPCGEDISYDPSFLRLENIFQSSGSDILGQEQVKQEPKWADIVSQCKDLLKRSKNLRVTVYLTLALLKKEGFQGLREGLSIIHNSLQKFWDSLYPQLDPDDGYDPVERLNIFMPFTNGVGPQEILTFPHRIIETPLCNSPQMGSFAFRDVQIAKGFLKVSAERQKEAPQFSVLEAAMKDTSFTYLKDISDAIAGSLEHLRGIKEVFSQNSRNKQSPNLEFCENLLREIGAFVNNFMGEEDSKRNESRLESGFNTLSPGPAQERLRGEISSPQEVISQLDKLCCYFEKYEPSSPVPLLLKRAKKLISKTFVEIIEDMCPDSVSEIERISGAKKNEEK